MVAHDPDPAGGHGDVELDVARLVAGAHVRLVERDAVDLDDVVGAARDVVAGQADDPLDEVVVGVVRQEADEGEPVVDGVADRTAVDDDRRGQPAARVLEDDDVAALEVERTRDELVDDDPVVDEEGVLHRARRDVERLEQPGLDDEGEGERHRDDEDELAHGRGESGNRAVGAAPGVRRRSRLVDRLGYGMVGRRHRILSGGGTGLLGGSHDDARGRRHGRAARGRGGRAGTIIAMRVTPAAAPLARPATGRTPQAVVVSRFSLIFAALPRRSRR